MNAALATKAGKALILASSMTLALNAAASASTTSAAVPLGSQATLSLASLYTNPPSGAVTLNGLPFQVGNAWQLSSGASATAAASFPKPLSVALLVNTQNSYYWYQGSSIGQVTLTFADGTTQSTDLVLGGNVRDWVTSAGFVVTSVTDASNTPAWTGTDSNGDTTTIDMLNILPPTGTTWPSLASVTVTSLGGYDPLAIMVDGIAVTYDPATPAPVRPGNSGNTPAATHSQAALHSNSANFTGQSPAQGQATGKAATHDNNGHLK